MAKATNCNIELKQIDGMSNCGNFFYRKKTIFHPSNSKKGIAIKGTNVRIEIKYEYYGNRNKRN